MYMKVVLVNLFKSRSIRCIFGVPDNLTALWPKLLALIVEDLGPLFHPAVGGENKSDLGLDQALNVKLK